MKIKCAALYCIRMCVLEPGEAVYVCYFLLPLFSITTLDCFVYLCVLFFSAVFEFKFSRCLIIWVINQRSSWVNGNALVMNFFNSFSPLFLFIVRRTDGRLDGWEKQKLCMSTHKERCDSMYDWYVNYWPSQQHDQKLNNQIHARSATFFLTNRHYCWLSWKNSRKFLFPIENILILFIRFGQKNC